MTHSIYEKAPDVEFHSQLLNDYVTLAEYGWTLLEELDREGHFQLLRTHLGFRGRLSVERWEVGG
jgi:hypothetical protein